ncbi:hypothetical protein ROA7450_03886 [Roseovarius albus]|uniref:Uncharacterized protein n=1 Tax=Roseovarius albus TaxID=1247867 RepID=A0A1X7A5T1_9RHOB|nr:hypothetical protein [Roseovarius albus]SLN70953.1 hypothetical protein ROA7450_03886 [Roseovarius albus]
MNKVVVLGAVGIAVLAVLIFTLNKPEPTPAEKLEQAVQDLGNAASDVGDALVEGGKGIQENLQEELQAAANDFADFAASSAESLSQQAQDLVAAWQDTGIISETGFEFEKAIQTLKDSTLDDATKEKIAKILDQIRDTPELAAEKLREIRDLLSQSG